MVSEHLKQWLGLPVQLFDATTSQKRVKDYARTVHRLALDWDAEVDLATLFQRFLADPASQATPAIIIGQFLGDQPDRSSAEAIRLLVEARDRLPQLKAIFLGEMISEESEISWIHQADVSPLLTAYPALEHLRVRGSDGLSLGGGLRHARLRSLTLETGGLPPEIIQEVAASQLPALEQLELWLGDPGYGGDATVEDVAPFLAGGIFPKLTQLGLRDSDIVDAIAAALEGAAVLNRLEVLDLSMGTLSDVGGRALLDNPVLRRLRRLDLSHHYLSRGMMASLRSAFPNVVLDEAQGETDPDERYVSVSE